MSIRSVGSFFWRQTQNLVGWFGLFLALGSLYLQIFGKSHDLNVIVTSYEPHKNWVTYGILYHNSGDYPETIISGNTSLIESKSSNISFGYQLEPCFEPVIVKPQESVHKYYSVQYPINSSAPENTGEISMKLRADFGILMPNGAVDYQKIYLGWLDRRLSKDGEISEIGIENNVLSVVFSSDEAKGLGSRMTPPNRKENDYPSCSKQIQPEYLTSRVTRTN